MSDIVRRLHDGIQLYSAVMEDSDKHMGLLADAAAEIERLRGLLRTGSIGDIDGINKTIYTSCDKCGSVIPHPAFEDKP